MTRDDRARGDAIYYAAHREEKKASQRAYNRKLRREVLDHYGRTCACCGETHEDFLAIDHPNGDGAADRKITGMGGAFYQWLRKHGYPSGYRVLCHNCNVARGLYGECPHEFEGPVP